MVFKVDSSGIISWYSFWFSLRFLHFFEDACFYSARVLIFMGRCTFSTEKEIVKCIENRPSGSETESEFQLPSWKKKSFEGD